MAITGSTQGQSLHQKRAKAKIAAGRVEYRVRIVHDPISKFEECNGNIGPLSEAEYRENQYMACPIHPRGDKSNDRLEAVRAWCGQTLHVGTGKVCGRAYEPVSYADYLQYLGNPDRHRYVGIIVDTQANICPHCDRGDGWINGAGLWSIDLMDDSPEWLFIRRKLDTPIRAAIASSLPGCLCEIAVQQLQENGYKS